MLHKKNVVLHETRCSVKKKKKKKKKKKLNKNVLNRSYVAPKNMLWQKKVLCGSKKRDSC